MDSNTLQLEFNNQLDTLLKNNYHTKIGLAEKAFIDLVEPVRNQLKEFELNEVNIKDGYLPFVIVVKSSLIPTEYVVERIKRGNKSGIVSLDPKVSTDFTTINNVSIPNKEIYLLIDIDRGKETLNITPEEALKRIQQANRSPLNIDEGVSILIQYPEFLIKNNCFSMLASRAGDQRVPALWISEGRTKLGWCWDRNPHTWLGSASCKERI